MTRNWVVYTNVNYPTLAEARTAFPDARQVAVDGHSVSRSTPCVWLSDPTPPDLRPTLHVARLSTGGERHPLPGDGEKFDSVEAANEAAWAVGALGLMVYVF